MILVCSLTLNIFFIIFKRSNFDEDERSELSWSKRAAKEAEAVAAISCSGHGRAYLDNPLFLEPFWMKNADRSAIMVAGWHRMSYIFNHSGSMSKQLEAQIHHIHDIVGNALTQGKYIIFGTGSTQLINAAIHALSPHNSSSPSIVVPLIPYYPLYKQQTEFFQEVEYKFEEDASLWMNNCSNDDNIIEIVTSPNNPDGKLNRARLQHPNAKAIYDRVYYWPQFTPISAPADDDIMLFSLSKLTGHAGTRFGWAVVKDEIVFTRMNKYLSVNTMGVSHESQLRALHLMKVIIDQAKEGETIFDFGYKTMRNRWEKLNEIVSVSKRFSLQKLESQYCNFFHKIRGPSPAYAWLKCLRKEGEGEGEEEDCYEIMRAANIVGRRGSIYGDEDKEILAREERKRVILNIKIWKTIVVTKKLVPTILLICSLSVNVIVFLKSGRINFDEEKEVVSWSKRAAIEGERVAAMSCSGHGRAYLDSYSLLSLDEEDDDDNEEMSVVCECNTCYTGSQCHTFIPSCPANAQRSAILVSGWHRMSYYFNQTGYMSKQLENGIRNLHDIVGNAVTKEKYIIFGTGSTQLINAAIHALSPSPNNSSSPSLVVPIIPYYLLYKQQTEFFQEVEYKFEEDASLWMKKMNNCSNDDNIIEIVTSPNNPDGKLNRARLQHPNAKAIYDRVYYWPQFTPISTPADDDIMLFSLSKLTVVKDETVFTKMNEYMNMNTVGVSHESQLRTLQLMKVITQGKKEEDEEETMFDFGYKTMKNRWEKLNEIISISKCFSLQELESDQYCNFFHKIRGPSPANILGCRGSNYGAQEKYRGCVFKEI
ncbi:hypothetical protein G4B88_008379 [Cannabis sativa]|uniref:Uncharacterized protein n=1 Tax=Cannabis sativa TaxID=3483 RepID=A0A7J6F5K8_CANSA|nr:hypothetical protein G4B88_008379 [Cannabis sativa]